MVGNGDFSWEHVCSYGVYFHSGFIALCECINWLKHIDAGASASFFFPLLDTCSLFSLNKHTGRIWIQGGIHIGSEENAEIKLLGERLSPLVCFMCSCLWTPCSTWSTRTTVSCGYVFSLPPVFYAPNCVSHYPLFSFVSTSKYRAKICLGGHCESAGAQGEDRVFAVIVNACVQPELGKREREV